MSSEPSEVFMFRNTDINYSSDPESEKEHTDEGLTQDKRMEELFATDWLNYQHCFITP